MGCSEGSTCPEATVEIKIKTLDSQTYTLRVDKCVPVPALKEQIATVTGVLSEQQRLICRGKVLKDDQLLSAYHVEDGHTLHLVARQPMHPSMESSVDHSVNDQTSGSGQRINQSGSSVVVGTFNISEPGDGALPDLSRIVSAVLGSFGVMNAVNGNEGADLSEGSPEGFFRFTHGGIRNSGGWPTDQTAASAPSNPGIGGPFSAPAPLDPLQLPVIPDSLTTLSRYLTRMRNEFSANVSDRGNSSQSGDSLVNDGQDSDAAAHSATGGLPTPAFLADVILSTRQLLTHQTADTLLQLARQLEDQANVADPLARTATQSNAIRTGVILQHLGALLLELGRTTMTLRMGQAPTEAVVNAGPAVFVSTSGPNPIMVQPLHFQHGATFGAIPTGTGQDVSGIPGGSVGSGFLPRNIDIRIRTAGERETTGVEQHLGQSNQSTTDTGSLSHEDSPAASRLPSSIRESEIRVIPIRTVVAALPASVRRPTSDTSHGSVGVIYPTITRVQRISRRGLQASNGGPSGGLGTGQQSNSNPTVPQNESGLPGGNAHVRAEDGAQNGQGYSTSISGGFDQLLRSIFPGEHIHIGDVNLQRMDTTSDSRTNPNTAAAATATATAQESAQVDGDGVFLSNLLHQIMPMISANTSGSSAGGEDDVTVDRNMHTSSTEGQENTDRGTRSRRHENSPSSPSSKRQRR